MLSQHAKNRMNQRGFNKHDVDFLYFLGEMQPAPGGAERLTITEEQIRNFRRILDRIPKGATLIIAGGRITTMYKSYRRTRKHSRSLKGGT